ncbi:MAG: hypothetical protein ACYTHJ_19345 [Planctomycetota bacterium]
MAIAATGEAKGATVPVEGDVDGDVEGGTACVPASGSMANGGGGGGVTTGEVGVVAFTPEGVSTGRSSTGRLTVLPQLAHLSVPSPLSSTTCLQEGQVRLMVMHPQPTS